MSVPGKDMEQIHQTLSADCFNATWELLDRHDRTPKDDEQMLLRAMASLWHWTKRLDATVENLSVGYWLVSRVHAVLGRAEEARRYGQLALDSVEGKPVDPFYPAYAHEALARAECMAGRTTQMEVHLKEAQRLSAEVTDLETRSMIQDDLGTIRAL